MLSKIGHELQSQQEGHGRGHQRDPFQLDFSELKPSRASEKPDPELVSKEKCQVLPPGQNSPSTRTHWADYEPVMQASRD